jgi:hypothetical protein
MHDDTGYTAKVAAVVAGALETGEHLVVATPAAPRGTMKSIAYGNGPGRTAHSRRVRTNPALSAGVAELDTIGVAYAPQYVLALTDRRLLWFRTTFTGRPKGLVGALHRGEVEDLRLGEAAVVGQRYGVVRVTLRDGRRARFEVARVHARRAARFVDTFHDDAATV